MFFNKILQTNNFFYDVVISVFFHYKKNANVITKEKNIFEYDEIS